MIDELTIHYALECKLDWCTLLLAGEQVVDRNPCSSREGIPASQPAAAIETRAPAAAPPHRPASTAAAHPPPPAGSKSIELRRYPPPPQLTGQRVWLLASGGPEGQPAFGDSVAAGSGELVGWVLFDVGTTVVYTTPEQLARDRPLHCVPPDSPYAQFPPAAEQLYGWRVVASARVEPPLPVPDLQRIHRSVYQRRVPPPEESL